MKKVVLSCVFSIISFANVFGMIPPEKKSASTISETSVSKNIAEINEDIRAFSDFLEEHKDEETLSPADQAELKQRFIDLEPAFSALLSFSNKDIYDCLKPFMLSITDYNTKLMQICLNSNDYPIVHRFYKDIRYYWACSDKIKFSNEDYSKIDNALIALCKLILKFASIMSQSDEYYRPNIKFNISCIEDFLQETDNYFTPLFFAELWASFMNLGSMLRSPGKSSFLPTD